MIFQLALPELLIGFAVVVLLFGPGRIVRTMGELGKGIQTLRKPFSSEEYSQFVSDVNLDPQ